jgi:hypothetical protein
VLRPVETLDTVLRSELAVLSARISGGCWEMPPMRFGMDPETDAIT